MAQVTGIGQCPPIESGYGRVVLGTFTSVSSDVYELKLAGRDDPIGVTSGHPIWSLDRGDWIAAGALRPGERLATAAGAAVVESIIAQPGERRVYNLQVELDHRYLIADNGLLVHNATLPCHLSTPEVGQVKSMDPSDTGIGLYNTKTGHVYMAKSSSLAPGGGGHVDLCVREFGEDAMETLINNGLRSDWRGFVIKKSSTTGIFSLENSSSFNMSDTGKMAPRFFDVLVSNVLSALNG